MESVDGDGFGVCDADHVAFDVGDRDGNRADDVEGVAEATSEESFVGGWRGGQKGTGNDGDSVVGFEKPNLFNKTGVTDVDKLSESGAGFGECIGDAGSLAGVGFVCLREAVQVDLGCGLDREFTEGELGVIGVGEVAGKHGGDGGSFWRGVWNCRVSFLALQKE